MWIKLCDWPYDEYSKSVIGAKDEYEDAAYIQYPLKKDTLGVVMYYVQS